MAGRKSAEWFGLLFFPFGVLLGLTLAWWREPLGAAMAAVSVTAFYVYEVLLAGRLPGGPWFLIFTAPAVLFFRLRETEQLADRSGPLDTRPRGGALRPGFAAYMVACAGVSQPVSPNGDAMVHTALCG